MTRLALVAALAACGEPAPTYAEIDPILQGSCGFSSCHGAGAGGLTLGTDPAANHAALVDVAAVGDPSQTLVVPGDPAASYLVHKLEGADGIVGDPMPPSVALSDDDIARIRAWIEDGADAP